MSITRAMGVAFLLLNMSLFCDAKTTASLSYLNSTLQVTETEILVKKDKKVIIHLESFSFNYQKFEQWQVEQQSPDKILLTTSLQPSVEFRRSAFDQKNRELQIVISKTESGYRFYAEPEWGRQVSMEFEYLDDHFFGLSEPLQPDNRLTPDLTGTSISVDVISEANTVRENYASAFSAFYMSSHGYGAFFDTFAHGKYDFAINESNRIHHESGVLDWHIFIGDSGSEIHQHYFSLIGKPKYVPIWGLGPIGWRDENTGSQQILEDIKKFTELKIPLTAWFVDRPYSDGKHSWSQMNFSQRFAKPQQWIKTINNQYGMEFMTWIASATFGDATQFDRHFKGQYSYIDLSHPPSAKAFQQRLKKHHHNVGVKGHKIDRTDEAIPEHEAWSEETPLAEKRNKYTWLVAKTVDEGIKETWQDNQFTFARAAIHRTQGHLSAIWGGDPRSTWEGLQSNFANAMRSSFMGFPVWGSDVGGYLGEGFIPEDLYLRWLQAGSMAGLFEIKLDGSGGEGRDRMPWQYNSKFQEIFRKICEERMRFLPYLHSLAATSANNGVLMKPMAYQHLGDKNTWQIWDQFYLGDAILVAPIFSSNNTRRIYLPEGKWRDFDKPSTTYNGKKWIDYTAGIETMPRFIAENSIYIQGETFLGNAKKWKKIKKQLKILNNPANKNGETHFLYVNSEDRKPHNIRLAKNKDTITIESRAFELPVTVVIYSDKSPTSVQLNKAPARYKYEKEKAEIIVDVPTGTEVNLTVEI